MTAHAGGAALPADRVRIRREMRARRRSLSSHECSAAAAAFARICHRHRLLRSGMRIAVYIAHGHEADLAAVIALARRSGCVLYLPAITNYRHHRMEFVRFERGTPLRPNRYGIPEPDLRTAARIPLNNLDLILIPLVAFDARGWRLGSGAGFYDRRLHRLRADRHWSRPRLIGVAYEFQRVPRLEPESWDVPLDGIITERNLYPALPSD